MLILPLWHDMVIPLQNSHSCCIGRCWTTWSTAGIAERWTAWQAIRWRPSCRPRPERWEWCQWYAGVLTHWTPAQLNSRPDWSARCWKRKSQSGRRTTENLHSHHKNTYNAGVTRATLASGLGSGGFQDGHSGLLVTVRYGSALPGRRLSAGLWRRSLSAAFCQLKDMCRQTWSSIQIVRKLSKA